MPELVKMIVDGFERHGMWFMIQIAFFVLLCGLGGVSVLWLKTKATTKSEEKDKKAIDNNNNNNVNVNVNVNEVPHAPAPMPVMDMPQAPVHEHNAVDLLAHPFFRTVKKMLSYEIQRLDIQERLRRAIFRDFLLIKFTIIHNNVKAFIQAGDMDQMSIDTFHNKMVALITDSMNEYEKMALDEEIPEIVIERFNYWHKGKSIVIFKFVDDVCEADDWYISNTIKFYSFLNQLVSILDLTLIDARRTLINLNGELDKVVYKGITVEPKKSHHHEPKDQDSIS